MTTEFTGTIINGRLELDEPLDLPDGSSLSVRVEVIEDWGERMREGLKELMRLRKDRPIHAGGRRYTRDELHEWS